MRSVVVAGKHRVLVVEDDPEAAAYLAEIVISLGHEPHIAHTLEEVRAALASGPFCYVLLDIEIPAEKGRRPLDSCGESALTMLRELDPRLTLDGKYHVFPIIVVTAHWNDPVFMTRLTEAHPTTFIGKPVNPSHLVERIRLWLSRAGREQHAACEADRAPSAEARRARTTLTLVGTSHEERTTVRANGRAAGLQDGHFFWLLRLAARHFEEADAWWTNADLKLPHKSPIPARTRLDLERQAPGAGAMIQNQKGVGYRIDPSTYVEPLDFERYAKHSHAGIQNFAKEQLQRKRRSGR